MYEDNPIKNDGRRKTRAKRLGPDAVCVLCGHGQWEALKPVRRSLLERHHVLGKVNAPDLSVPLCRNCHAKITERLHRAGASMRKSPTLLHRLVSIFRALGEFVVRLGQSFLDMTVRLLRLADALDRRYPGWRTMPEAA